MADRVPRSASWKGLHGALAGEGLPPARPIGVKMKLHHRTVERGKWSGEIVFEKGAANSLGIIHGGFLASILDIAMGYASLTLLGAHESQRTLEMKINFLSGVPPDVVLADGEVLRRGRRTTYCEGSVRTSGGTLIARGSATFTVRSQD